MPDVQGLNVHISAGFKYLYGEEMAKNLHPYLQMVRKAMEDGTITREEKALMESISHGYGIYLSSVVKAREDGVIDEAEEAKIKELRKRIYEESLKTALEDGKIADDEKALLDIIKGSLDLDDSTLELIEEKVAQLKGEE